MPTNCSVLRGVLVAMLIVAGSANAQNKGKSSDANRKDEQRENARVKEAQQAVDKAQQAHRDAAKDVTAASQQLTRAEASKRQAVDQAQDVRKQVQEQQESRLGLPALLTQQDAAQKAYDAAAAPVLQALHATGPYLAAVADAKAAHEELQAARRANPSAVEAGNEDALSALVRRTLKPGELEKAAVEANPAAQAARQALGRVQDKVKAAREATKMAVESSSSLRSALNELDSRNTAVDRAKADLARDRQRLAAAAGKVEQERQQLARAIAADRKDDNKNNQKKNDKKPNNKK